MLLLQEGANVTWDPAYTCHGNSASGWEALIAAALFPVAIYLHWRGLRWLVSRKWPGLRYWFPFVALLGVAVPAGLCGGGFLMEAAVTVWGFANWPAIVGGVLAAYVLEGAGAGGWSAGIAAAIAGWLSWYLLIVVLEAYAVEEPAPVALRIT